MQLICVSGFENLISFIIIILCFEIVPQFSAFL